MEIAKYPSAHMMTAGLMDQEAFIDEATGMSIFTQYLVEGFTGKADYTKDEVISLTELLIYVQDKVSTKVETKYHKAQTPVMGKIKGAGEMIFLLNK
jgi:uncharacterized caspase-like protein